MQFMALGTFIALVVMTSYPHLITPPSNLMLRMDGLYPLQYLLANRSLSIMFWPALVIICLTILSGRFFCGWICPLGTCFDITGYLKPSRRKYYRPSGMDIADIREGSEPRRNHKFRIKYLVLAAVSVTAVFSVNILFLFSPMSIANRGIHLILALSFPILFFILLLLSFLYRPRYWCQEICPLGALYSLLSSLRKKLGARWLALSVSKDVDACIRCGECYRACPFEVVEPFTRGEDGPLASVDCALCGECVSACPAPGALTLQSFGLRLACSRGRARGGKDGDAESTRGSVDKGRVPGYFDRRDFIGLAAIGAVTAAGYLVGARDGGDEARILRPPGAQDEERFLANCIRCGECVRACPTGCIQPMTMKDGFQRVWTPRFEPERASCRFDIDDQACQKVCPVNAILETPAVRIRIGTAQINRDRCISWRYGRLCLICMEQCRFQAITADGQDRPHVNPDICTGCGACEYACIATPELAIKVFPEGYEEEGFNGDQRRRRRGG